MSEYEQGMHLCLECNCTYECDYYECDECEEEERLKWCEECNVRLDAMERMIDKGREN